MQWQGSIKGKVGGGQITTGVCKKKKKGTDTYFYSLIFALKEGKKFNQSYKNKTKNKG